MYEVRLGVLGPRTGTRPRGALRSAALGRLCCWAERVAEKELVRPKLCRRSSGFREGFRLNLSDFCSPRRTPGARSGLGFSGCRPPRFPTPPVAIPCPLEQLGLLGNWAAAGWHPTPAFSLPGFLLPKLSAGSKRKGNGILLNFYTVLSSLFRGEIHLVCPSREAPRELQQFESLPLTCG